MLCDLPLLRYRGDTGLVAPGMDVVQPGMWGSVVMRCDVRGVVVLRYGQCE